MADTFVVKLEPFTLQETVGNLTVTKSLNQDRVIIVTDSGQRTWGYCSTFAGHEVFLPLSGFPKELVPEVQRQINILKGYADGDGPLPAEVIETGPNAEEHWASLEESAEDVEEYED